MSDLTPEGFDRWYAEINSSPSRDSPVSEWLELPDGIRSTGVLAGPAFAEVMSALALAPGSVLLDLAGGEATGWQRPRPPAPGSSAWISPRWPSPRLERPPPT